MSIINSRRYDQLIWQCSLKLLAKCIIFNQILIESTLVCSYYIFYSLFFSTSLSGHRKFIITSYIPNWSSHAWLKILLSNNQQMFCRIWYGKDICTIDFCPHWFISSLVLFPYSMHLIWWGQNFLCGCEYSHVCIYVCVCVFSSTVWLRAIVCN